MPECRNSGISAFHHSDIHNPFLFMEQEIIMTTPDIAGILHQAWKQTGVDRETLLLYALKLNFDCHSATAEDWKNALPEATDRWRRQFVAVLQHLEFCTASAEAYSGQSADLSGKVQAMQHKLAEIRAEEDLLEARETELKHQLSDMEARCAAHQRDTRKSQQHMDALQAETERYRQEIIRQKQAAELIESQNVRLNQEQNDAVSRNRALEAEQTRLQEQVQTLQEEIENRKQDVAGLRQQIDRQDSDIRDLEQEASLLKELHQLLQNHQKIADILGVEQARALADADLVARMKTNQNRLTELQQRISADLSETDRLLAEEIGLNQKQWEDLQKWRG